MNLRRHDDDNERDELAAVTGASEQNVDHHRELIDGEQETRTNQSSET